MSTKKLEIKVKPISLKSLKNSTFPVIWANREELLQAAVRHLNKFKN